MEDYESYGGYEVENNGEVKEYDFKSIYTFSILSFLAMLFMSLMYGTLTYSIAYIILFYSVIILLDRFAHQGEWIIYSGIGFLYLLLLLMGKEMFIAALMTLPIVVFIWIKEGKKEDARWFLIWNLVIYIFYYSLYSIATSIYIYLVFPHFPNNPAITYVLLLFPLYYILYLGYFYHLITKFQNLLEREHKLYKLEYSILYSSLYTILSCLITYFVITGF